MTARNPNSISVGSGSVHLDPDKNKPLTDEERERIRGYYRSLNFKELLAVCPIDGIDLTREPEFPREVDL